MWYTFSITSCRIRILLVLQSNIKTFQENNAIGIMEQAAYQSRGGEFAELRSYLISRLLGIPIVMLRM